MREVLLRKIIIAGILSICIPQLVNASTVYYQFSGQTTAMTGSSTIPIGNSFNITIEVDTALSGTLFSSGGTVYTEYQFTNGQIAFDSGYSGSFGGALRIDNDDSSGSSRAGSDWVQVSTFNFFSHTLPANNGQPFNNFFFYVGDSSGTAINDENILTSINTGDWDTSDGNILWNGSSLIHHDLAGTFDDISTTPVPIPAAVWLFGSTLGLLGWIRRKAA